MNLLQRKLLMGGLLAAFVVQTAMVYTDDTADGFAPLSEEALRGRRLWHRHNCQTCHQIHGFGGFLGPDLTNAGKRLTKERLDQVLTVGSAQMPAFHFSEDEILDMDAFFYELSDMGVGVPRAYPPLDVMTVLGAVDAHVQESNAPAPVVRGALTFKSNCISCHTPLQATPLGLQTAPDLTTAMQRNDEARVRDTITNGRPDRGMQAWGHLGEAAVADLTAFVKWLNDERAAIASKAGVAGDPRPIPWWEYR
ncbi:MAG: c-type cytochrome [Planctomycetes bacterium]|nr:c-type cytochrome [Planctomycetota bacterium]